MSWRGPSPKLNASEIECPMSEALLQNSEYRRRDGNYFLCGPDRGPRRREDSLNHADHVLDSRDHDLCEAEYLLDQGDHFPDQPEDSLRLCDHGLRRSD